MMNSARSLDPALTIGLILTVGCQDPGSGLCIHTYRDPVLAITAANDGTTGARIPSLLIADITISGQARPPASLLAVAFGARAQGDTIVCGVPCGFGVTEGPYEFTAVAPGYAPRQVAVDAHFARFQGGCPSFNEGSTEVAVSLPRSP